MNNINNINTMSGFVGFSVFRQKPTKAHLSGFVGFPLGTRQFRRFPTQNQVGGLF